MRNIKDDEATSAPSVRGSPRSAREAVQVLPIYLHLAHWAAPLCPVGRSVADQPDLSGMSGLVSATSWVPASRTAAVQGATPPARPG